MSVIVGASFDNIVCLDIDDMTPQSLWNRDIEDKARRIGNRFQLGDCLIILSSYHSKSDCLDWSYCNYHLVYDRITTWRTIHGIIKTLARGGILEKRLANLQFDRQHFTTRMTSKTMDSPRPFPIGYVKCFYPEGRHSKGGIRMWLREWRTIKSISKDI